MGKKENPLVQYYSKNSHFAGLLNGWLFGGREYLLPSNVSDEDRRMQQGNESGKGRGKREYRERYRDIYKRVENASVHLLIGTELQEHVNYIMPLRVMDYDTLTYLHQKAAISDRHGKAKDLKGAEYLSGFAKKDRLFPAVTLVLYCGEKPWDGAKSLHELLEFGNMPEELRQYVENYRIHVLDICHTPDERLREFPPDICFMFLFLKYQKNKEILADLKRLVGQEVIGEEAYQTLAEYVNEPQLWEVRDKVREEGGLNMCEAIREMVAEGEKKGILIGEKRGEKLGKKIGKKQGEDCFAKLTGRLLEDARLEDLKEAVENEAYRRRLYKEYGISF